jgi:hypothetical protein
MPSDSTRVVGLAADYGTLAGLTAGGYVIFWARHGSIQIRQ